MAAQYDASGTLQYRYIFGPGADEPLLQYNASGVRTWYTADERGSIIGSSNDSGAFVLANTYDEYGIPGSSNSGRFQYTGQMWIPELGMYFYKARAYSPTLGRFLQTDPIGYGDGMNWYAYTHNDPVNLTDPMGLVPSGTTGTTSQDILVTACVNGGVPPLCLTAASLDTLNVAAINDAGLDRSAGSTDNGCPTGGAPASLANGQGVSVVLPNHQTVADPFSPTGNLMSPTSDLSQVAQDGKQVGDAVSSMLSGPAESAEGAYPFLMGSLAGAVGTGGKYDFQRSGNFISGFTQHPQFRDVSNFNVGVFGQQANLTEPELLDIAGRFASLFSSNAQPKQPNGLDPRTRAFIREGYQCSAFGAFK